MRYAVEDHPQGESGKRQQDENKIGGLLASQLERGEAALLGCVDLLKSLYDVFGVLRVKEFSAR